MTTQSDRRTFLQLMATGAVAVALPQTSFARDEEVSKKTFTYKTVDQLLNAVIQWGDSTRSDGKLVGSYATGKYYVEGTHTYAKPGDYKVHTTVQQEVITVGPYQPPWGFDSRLIAELDSMALVGFI